MSSNTAESGDFHVQVCVLCCVCCVCQTLTCCCFLPQAARPRRRSSPAPARICRAPRAAPCWLPHPERRAQRTHVTAVTTADGDRRPADSTGPTVQRRTLRMRMKSCLSTRRKWQLSSLRMMVAARGASFSKASCPKSSPSCKVVTSPCASTRFHVRRAAKLSGETVFQYLFFILKSPLCVMSTYLPVCDDINRAFPDDVPGSALVSLTEHCNMYKFVDTNHHNCSRDINVQRVKLLRKPGI